MQPVHMSMPPVRTRAPHRGRMRGGQNSNNSRREYTPRQQQDSPNPTPQSSQQRDRGGDRGGNSNMPPSQPQQASHQQQQPPQQMDGSNQPTMGYPSYAYQYSYPAVYGHQGMMHSQAASAAQNATGTPIYLAAAPYMHHPHHMYNYPVIYSHMMPQDYNFYEDNGDTMYYTSIQEPDINHNPTPGETPTMLSPANYAPIYEPQMHEMHQQMNAMHIYDQQVSQQPPHMIGPIVDIEQGGEGIQLTEQMLSPHEQEAGIVGPGQVVPHEGSYILAPVVVDNQLNNSGEFCSKLQCLFY